MDSYKLYKDYVKELGQFDPNLSSMTAEDIKDWVDSYKSQKKTDWIDIYNDLENVIGFFVVSSEPQECHPDADYEICQVYVDPVFRRQGLASKTVKEYLKKHPGHVSLDILTGNYVATRFWYETMRDMGAKYVDMDEIRNDDYIEHLTLHGYIIPEKRKRKVLYEQNTVSR